MSPRYWLFKSEPETFSLTDLQAVGEAGEIWDGVRNYQARNFLRDDCRVGDIVLFYHSNTKEPGIVGEARIVETEVEDPTQFDQHSVYFDPKSSRDKPRWYTVKIRFVKKWKRAVTLTELKSVRALQKMPLVQRGNRLSISPVSAEEYQVIKKLI